MSDTLADESRSFRGGFSFSEGILGIYCHLLTPGPDASLSSSSLSHSLFSHCLRSCWMCFIYFPIFYALQRLCSSHFGLFLSSQHPISLSCLTAAQTVAQESVVGLASHPRRACLVSPDADESLCSRITARSTTCHLRRSASH